MIRTCKSCKSKCCEHGPGPYKLVAPEVYLENFGTAEAYNTKCIAMSSKGHCKLWKTKEFPQECRTYVCQSRTFSKLELKKILAVVEHDCPKCGCSWMLYTKKPDGSMVKEHCEACGHKALWVYKKL